MNEQPQSVQRGIAGTWLFDKHTTVRGLAMARKRLFDIEGKHVRRAYLDGEYELILEFDDDLCVKASGAYGEEVVVCLNGEEIKPDVT